MLLSPAVQLSRRCPEHVHLKAEPFFAAWETGLSLKFMPRLIGRACELCLAFALKRTSPEPLRPFVLDRDEVPEQVPERVREVGSF